MKVFSTNAERPPRLTKLLFQRVIATARRPASCGIRQICRLALRVHGRTSSQARRGVPPVRWLQVTAIDDKELFRGDDPDSQRV